MTSSEQKFLHCSVCGKVFEAGGVLLAKQPGLVERVRLATVGALEAFECAGCQALPPVVSTPAPAPVVVPAAKAASTNCRKAGWRIRNSKFERVIEAPHGCPPEREFNYAPVHAGLSAKEYHEAFIASTTCAEGDRRVLRYLMDGFDGVQPGAWRSGIEIQERCGVKAANSCAARLRAQVDGKGWDIDSRVIAGEAQNHWAYRICRIEDSERLKREEKSKQDKRQQEFEPGARNS